MKLSKKLLAGVLAGLLVTVGLAMPASAYDAPNSDVQRILDDTNALRASQGLAPLALNESMTSVAQNWSQSQASANTMSHNPNYSSQIPSGWTRAAENVAYGYAPSSVVNAWANSSGHRANMLGDFTDIGIGLAKASNGAYYYTQVFAKYASSSAGSTATPKLQSSDFSISTHIQKIGWTNSSGTTGKALRMEALKLTQNGSLQICAKAHVQSIGWQSQKCTSGKGTSITVGTTGRALRMEALQLWSPNGVLTAQARVQKIGWQGKQTSAGAGQKITIGTTGKALRMEAVRLFL